MLRPTTRLAAGALVLALPLAAAAGCGVEKKRSIKAEFRSAASNLDSSKAVSFSLSLSDTKGKLAALAKKNEDEDTKSVLDTVFGGRITVTIDPTGARTLADLSSPAGCGSSTDTTDLNAELKKVNLSIAVADATSTVAEIRLVDGAVFAHVDLKEIGAVATKGGVKDFDGQLNDAITSADPSYAQALTDARAGKWLTLPLSKYLTKFQDLAKSFTQANPEKKQTISCAGATKAGKDLLARIKPYVTVTDANDSSADRVLDVKVKVRPALKAALGVLQSAKGLPFGDAFGKVDPKEIDSNVAVGTAKGTITLASGHLKQVTVDLDAIRALDPSEKGKDDVQGSAVVLDINDAAPQVTAPSDVSTFDVGALLDQFLNGFSNSGTLQSSIAVQG